MPSAPDGSIELLVNIDVEDLDAAIRFYSEGLGFRLERCLFDGTVAQLNGAAVQLFLLQKAAGTLPVPGAGAQRGYRRHWTPVHLDIAVVDIEVSVERAVRAGARLEGGIATHVWGKHALLSDPFGHGFCLLQWLGDGYAAAAGGQHA